MVTVLCTGEVMICVLDFKRDVGLWHGILTVSQSVCLSVDYHNATCDIDYSSRQNCVTNA